MSWCSCQCCCLGLTQIEQDGWVTVVAYSDEALEAGLQAIRDVVAEIETGTIYRCTAPVPGLDASFMGAALL